VALRPGSFPNGFGISTLDASLVFARDGQIYLLALSDGAVSSELYGRMKGSFAAYFSGTEQALSPRGTFLVGNDVTLADVCFVAEFCLFHNEQARSSVLKRPVSRLYLTTNSQRPIHDRQPTFNDFWHIPHSCQTLLATWKD
jgi:hypothetical protein